MSASQYNAYYERGGWIRDSQYPYRYIRNLSNISALPTDPAAKKSALDLGCGLGEFSECLAETGFEEVVGIDLSSKAIELCENNPSKSKHTHYIQADFFRHNFRDQKFDFILAAGFSPFNTSNIQQIDRTLQQLKSLVHSNSSIAVTVPTNGRSGNKSWYYWDVNEIEHIRMLALQYFENVKMHFFTRIARPRWPVFKFSRFNYFLLRLICSLTNKNVVLTIVLQSPRAK